MSVIGRVVELGAGNSLEGDAILRDILIIGLPDQSHVAGVCCLQAP